MSEKKGGIERRRRDFASQTYGESCLKYYINVKNENGKIMARRVVGKQCQSENSRKPKVNELYTVVELCEDVRNGRSSSTIFLLFVCIVQLFLFIFFCLLDDVVLALY